MFGWEFPPHISGGLGTACQGLTHSLIRQGVEVLFVVPRLQDDQLQTYNFLIDANGAITRNFRNKGQTPGYRNPKKTSKFLPAGKPIPSHYSTAEGGRFAAIGIPSTLKAYGQISVGRSAEHFLSLMNWDYALARTQQIPDRVSDVHRDGQVTSTQSGVNDEHMMLTGIYGDNLMAEVMRYGELAAIIASQYNFDVIHAHDWMTFPAGIAAKRRHGKPLVVHVHSTEFDRSGHHPDTRISKVELQGLKEADRVVTVSNWTKKVVTTRYQIPGEDISVIYNGVMEKGPPEAFAFPDIGSHFVTFLGRVTYQKGPFYYVEAARKVLEEFPDAHFIVAGAGDLLPQIIERVAQLNMSTRFHFTGFLTGIQIDQIWSLTDVYVMPSVSEPFGLAPLEAIQRDVPVIISNQSGVAEVMPHAIKVDFWDVNALAAAICSVLRYESLSHVLRQKSKEHIQHLTWDKAASDVKSLYHELQLET